MKSKRRRVKHKPRPPLPGLSITAYAKRRGVSEGRIRKLVKDGVVSLNGARRIDPERADEEIAVGLDPAFSHLGPLANLGPGRQNSGAVAPKAMEARRTAQAFGEHFRAKLSELEYRRRVGELVDRSEIRNAIFALLRPARDALLQVHLRIRSVVAAETDEVRVGQIIQDEIRRTLESVTDNEILARL